MLISTQSKKDLCVLKSTQNDDKQEQFQGTDTNRSKSEGVSSHFLGRPSETSGNGDGVSCLDGIQNPDLASLNLKVESKDSKPVFRQPTIDVHSQNSNFNDWKDIKNIVDLTDSISEMRFYPGDSSNMTPSVVRCETCYNLLMDRMNLSKKENAVKVALRGIGKYSGSLSSGLLLSTEKTESLMTGGNQYWYEIKRCIKQHLSCTGDHSKLHFEALQHQVAVNKRVSSNPSQLLSILRMRLLHIFLLEVILETCAILAIISMRYFFFNDKFLVSALKRLLIPGRCVYYKYNCINGEQIRNSTLDREL